MVPQAQNALLKTLEEPPSASVFLLVSSMPDALLPTVRSRCPRLRFAALPAADVATVLVRDHEFTAADARAAAARADGSVGGALVGQLGRPGRGARNGGRGCCEQVARGGRSRRAASTRPRMLTPAKKAPPGWRTRPARGLPARDVVAAARPGVIGSQASTPALLANADLRRTICEALARSYDADGAACAPTAAVDRGAGRARAQRQPEGRGRLAGAAAVSGRCETARRDHASAIRPASGRRSRARRPPIARVREVVRAGALRPADRARVCARACCRPTPGRAAYDALRRRARRAGRRACTPWPPRQSTSWRSRAPACRGRGTPTCSAT